jgi:hypothetical protein
MRFPLIPQPPPFGFSFQLLFSLLLLLELLDLLTLTLELPLLLLELTLRLLALDLLILHLVADHVAAGRAQAATDRRTGSRMADGGPDDRAGTSAEQSADTSSFLACGQRLARASSGQQQRR